MRWVPPLGVLGAAIGAIAIGTAATSTSTTIIISIRTTISTASKTVSSNTTHNTAEMLPMVTGEQQIGLVAMRVSSRVAVVLAVVVASEEQVVRVAPVVPAVQVAPVVRVVRVAPVVPENPVVPELETAPVAALELVLVQVAVALRTKSATAAHPHDRVVARRVEDLAAAAETTREPAAAEAAVAWEAAE